MANSNNKRNYSNKKDRGDSYEGKEEYRGRSNKSGKKSRSNRRSNQRSNDSYDSGANISPTNDPAYYALNPQLLIDAASHAFSDASGTRIPWSPVEEHENILVPDIQSIPGVMSFRIAPTVGISTDQSSAVNVAARNIYSYVRHANSGHSNYDAPDLMMYLLAMDNLYSFYSYMVRAYGVLNIYTQKNRYYPEALVRAMGIDFDDAIKNIANFRLFINTFAVKLGSLCVPAGMSYFLRHMQMYSGVYVDDVSQKAASYLLTPAGFLMYNEYTGAGKLDFVTLDGDSLEAIPPKCTIKQIMELGTKLINAVMLSEDMNIMSGDILKAYSANGIFKVSTIAENYMVLPSLDQNMLMQIQNLTMLTCEFAKGNSGYIEDLSVSQDPTTGMIKYKPEWEFSNPQHKTTLMGIKLITMPTDSIDPGMIMDATRLSNITVPGSTAEFFTVNTCGSELCLDAFMWYYGVPLGTPTGWELQHLHLVEELNISITRAMTSDGGYGNLIDALDAIGRISTFDWHPNFKVMTNFENEFYRLPIYMQDINNYSAFTANDLKKMNDVALLSEFNCPQVASSTFQLAKR